MVRWILVTTLLAVLLAACLAVGILFENPLLTVISAIGLGSSLQNLVNTAVYNCGLK